MIIAWWAVAVMLLGIVLWNLPKVPRVSEAGKILFAIGAFVATWHLGTITRRLW